MLQELHLDPMSTLFHEETAAVNAYRYAMVVHRGTEVAARLREMFVNHREAAGLLRRHVQTASPRTDDCIGAWNAVHEIRADNQSRPVLEALKAGETCNRELYAKTLKQVDLPPGGRSLIAAILLPQTERHLAALERMMMM